jgi:hypothetical protein
VLVPVDRSQLATLRAQTRERAAMVARGECPMMMDGVTSRSAASSRSPRRAT